MSDELNLIEKSKNGDAYAFSELAESYQKKILNFTFRMLGNLEDAEDVTQEVFIKAFRNISKFDGKSSFSTWLYKIASNAATDELRKRKRRGTDKVISLYQEDEDGEYELTVSTDGDEPYEKLQKKDAQKVLLDAIEKLGEEHKNVIIMRDVQNLTYDEIAKITGQSLGTVKSRISRARLILRKILEKNRELFIK